MLKTIYMNIRTDCMFGLIFIKLAWAIEASVDIV